MPSTTYTIALTTQLTDVADNPLMNPGTFTFTTGAASDATIPSVLGLSPANGDLGVPTNILATRLRELEAAGVLSRLPLRHNTRAYALTDRGLALREAIVALGRWGQENA